MGGLTSAGGRLPPSFTSLYRLFLRTSAVSVLGHRPAFRQLRILWRPCFESAAQVLHRVQRTSGDQERERLQRWYNVWEARMDNTLSLLSVSARSRGLAHRATRNLQSVMRARSAGGVQKQKWNPQLSPSSEHYKPITIVRGTRAGNRLDKIKQSAQVEENAWNALGEAITMAEGRDGITLGRLRNR
ncbi:hypothetical protein WOLCODRAFT_140046 [Wolfiporia cocos MD-104 SS10]|uniref:Uncharacterized protein n=1 Tax=Wolfiporia cocos (strain MD-104) TaxID=742152 RepID=A0A2H3J7H1_WOLCO|nr:hypothetical protein WOLCODRAFT_140046 [Wolfiporia cocos MD-104 SS10]